jgi:FkbM family methyltransferase
MFRPILDFIGAKFRRGIQHLAGFWNLWSLSEQHQRQSAALHERLDRLAEAVPRLQTQDGISPRPLAEEIDRLDGYLVYHVGTLHEQIDVLTSRAQANQEQLLGAIEAKLGQLHELASKLQVGEASRLSYVQAGLDALLVTAEFDLLVPTSETGLLAFLLRHGFEAIEPGVRAVLRARLRAGGTAVDVGANIGLHTLTMARSVGSHGRVICLEPLPHIAATLERTLRLNGFGNRTLVIRSAAAECVGERTLHCTPHSPMSSLFPVPGESASQIVHTIALDDHFAPGERVDLVKIDVEGAEPLVYQGMSRILRENPEIELILEWSASHFARSAQSPDAFWDSIRRDGFKALLIDDEQPGTLVALQRPEAVLDAANLLLTRH